VQLSMGVWEVWSLEGLQARTAMGEGANRVDPSSCRRLRWALVALADATGVAGLRDSREDVGIGRCSGRGEANPKVVPAKKESFCTELGLVVESVATAATGCGCSAFATFPRLAARFLLLAEAFVGVCSHDCAALRRWLSPEALSKLLRMNGVSHPAEWRRGFNHELYVNDRPTAVEPPR